MTTTSTSTRTTASTSPARPFVPFHRPRRRLDAAGRYCKWIARNPHVLDAAIRLAEEAQEAGLRRLGPSLIIGKLRWEMAISTKGDTFKINNNHSSYLIRDVCAERPDLAGLFKLRSLRTTN